MTSTIPSLQRKVLEALQEEDDIGQIKDILKGLDKEIGECYSSFSQLLGSKKSPNELQHNITNLLEMCCCEFWRIRISGSGDYCPGCVHHRDSVGLNFNEIRVERKTRFKV